VNKLTPEEAKKIIKAIGVSGQIMLQRVQPTRQEEVAHWVERFPMLAAKIFIETSTRLAALEIHCFGRAFDFPAIPEEYENLSEG